VDHFPWPRTCGRWSSGGRSAGAAAAGPGQGRYASRTNPDRKVPQHVRERQALGYTVTLNPAA